MNSKVPKTGEESVKESSGCGLLRNSNETRNWRKEYKVGRVWGGESRKVKYKFRFVSLHLAILATS